MVKTTKGQAVPGEHKKRLQEIAEVQLGSLSDDEVLRFLSERKRLSDLEQEYERVQKEEMLRLEQEKKEQEVQRLLEQKKQVVLEKIEELNRSITPDKDDDDLLVLVAQRKELEKELADLGGEIPTRKELPVREVAPKEEIIVPPVKEVISEMKPEPVLTPKKEVVPEVASEVAPKVVSPKIESTVEEEYGGEKIKDDGIKEGSEFERYFDQLKNNAGSIGELLQNMPVAAKKNKAFMLKVAAIDPAYAMHYADKETLKNDEDFNLRIAALDNPRNSGNALSEMFPEARTSKVLLTAVKRDYINIRFIQPNMADYDEMLSIAKKAALDKVKELKEAADIALLVPKPLQQDKQFMLQVNEIIGASKGK